MSKFGENAAAKQARKLDREEMVTAGPEDVVVEDVLETVPDEAVADEPEADPEEFDEG